MATGLDTRNHVETARLGRPDMTKELNDALGATLVAYLANVRDRSLPLKWAREDGPEPRPETLKRLLLAHRALRTILLTENLWVTRAWFIGTNPRLGEETPVDCLREGKLKEVMVAASTFADGSTD